jgi:hypothetical protein
MPTKFENMIMDQYVQTVYGEAAPEQTQTGQVAGKPFRIDIFGVGEDMVSEEQVKKPLTIDITTYNPPDKEITITPEEPGTSVEMPGESLTDIATRMAAGTEPPGATPMTLGEFATSAADVPAGLLKGAIQGTLGVAGDIESIVYGVRELFRRGADESRLDAFLRGIGEGTVLPTTDDVKKWMDTNVGPLVPAGASERRTRAAKVPEFIGELFGAGQAVTEGARVAARGARQIGQEIATTPPRGSIQIPSASMELTDMPAQNLSVAREIVSQGIATDMSPTKMIQAFERQTGSKMTGRQQKELKDFVSQNIPKGKIYSDQAFKDLVAQPFPFEPSTQRFAEAFDNAIGWLRTLDANNLRNAAILSDQRLAPILGTDAQGKTKRLLTTNGKLLKTETGVEGGVPIELPDGRNIESAGLAISPAFKVGKFSTCPNSASCAQECLGKTSGGYFAYGGGADLEAMKGTRLRSFRMTQAMFREPEAFAIKINNEIVSLKNAAAKNGNALAIRLNVLSDIDPKVYKSIIESHPDVFFYDYTKMKYRPVAPNHHYTYSSTGLSQKAGQNGLASDVDNPHGNWPQMRQWLDDGQNVAMAFSSKKALPESVLDESTGKIYRVIDGDAYDFRPMDMQPAGMDGVIVGLKNKAMTRKESAAAQDSKGFFVNYDPKLGTQVLISPQKREAIMLRSSGAEQPSLMETGEQITERATK